MMDSDLYAFLSWSSKGNDKFFHSVVENLIRYPADVKTFVSDPKYLGLTTVYPEVIKALEEIYHPTAEGLDHPLRIGTEYREVVLTGSIGCAKTYSAVLGILYAVYLLSCLRSPHKLFGLDAASEIVFLFQSIRLQTGGVAYKLARELIEGSKFFTKHFPKDKNVKNEILLPHNIVIRSVSGDQTAAIGMNIASVLLDEMSYMKYHSKSVHSESGGEYDQAQALYASARTRIDSRFNKFGRHICPMFLAGSARHDEDFIQCKIKERDLQLVSQGTTSIYVYNKKTWEVKPWDFSGDTFRVYLGKGSVPPQIAIEGDDLYASENVLNVPVELKPAFESQGITQALRDHCGVPSAEIGSFIVEVEKTKSRFCRDNIFAVDSCTFQDGDTPKMYKTFLENPETDRVWFCHLDLSRTGDSTGLALGYVDRVENHIPHCVVAGVLEVKPVQGKVIPWDQIMCFLFRLSKYIPLRVVTADQYGAQYIWEQLTPYGYKVGKISNNASSDIYHEFQNVLSEGTVEIASHPKAVKELLALNVDEKTGKVSKPAGGSQDCADAVVSLVCAMRKYRLARFGPEVGMQPTPPKLEKISGGGYRVKEQEKKASQYS